MEPQIVLAPVGKRIPRLKRPEHGGEADFAVMLLSTGIVKRARGLRILNIAQMVQRSALMLVIKKSNCTEETFRKNPGLCVRFVKASIEGKYAFAHQEEAIDIVMKYVNEANVATNRVHQEWMLARMKDIMLPLGQEGIPMGRLLETAYDFVALEFERNRMIDRVPSFSKFYVSCVPDAEK